MLRRFTPAIGVLLLVLSQVLWAIDLTQDIEPQGPLQIRLDYGLATRRNKDNTEKDHEYVFTSHLTFNGPVSTISDGQLVELAFDAHDEMNANFKAYRPKGWENAYPDKIPSVMTALAFGQEIIFASSQTGGRSFIESVGTSRTWKALNQCQILWGELTGRDEDHTHGRHCGEVMAFHQYDVVHGGKDITSFEGEPRIVSVLQSKRLVTRALKVHDPCGAASSSPDTDEAWGCNFFMKQRMPGVRVIPESQEGVTYVLDNLSSGRPKISSIGICTRAKAKRMDMDESGPDAPEDDTANTHVPVVDVLV